MCIESRTQLLRRLPPVGSVALRRSWISAVVYYAVALGALYVWAPGRSPPGREANLLYLAFAGLLLRSALRRRKLLHDDSDFLFPLVEGCRECARFPSEESRRYAVESEYCAIRPGGRLLFALPTLVLAIGLFAIGPSLANRLAVVLPVLPYQAWWTALVGLTLAGLYVAWWVVVRARVQRRLRTRLVRLGVPICVGCGYDLTGNMSGRCPECGQQVRPCS